MSTSEYYDMFIERQNKGNYHMFVFDIIDSKKMNSKERNNAEVQMEKLMNKIYNEIKTIEKQKQIKILIIGIDEIVSYEERYKVNKKWGLLFEPFIFADTFGLTIHKNSLSKEEILNIFYKYKKELNINFDFHISDGFYETNNWIEGNPQIYRGYCMDILSNYHNKYNKVLKKKNV